MVSEFVPVELMVIEADDSCTRFPHRVPSHTMSSSGGSVRQRKDKKRTENDLANGVQDVANKAKDVAVKAKDQAKQNAGSEWDYKIAIVVITILAFLTRFYGLTYPSQVVFDEVHFGKVRPPAFASILWSGER